MKKRRLAAHVEDARWLGRALDKALRRAAGVGDPRLALRRVALDERDGHLRVTASDGFRLVSSRVPTIGPVRLAEEESRVALLLTADEARELRDGTRRRRGAFTLELAETEGLAYPDVDAAIWKRCSAKTPLAADRKEVRAALRGLNSKLLAAKAPPGARLVR